MGEQEVKLRSMLLEILNPVVLQHATLSDTVSELQKKCKKLEEANAEMEVQVQKAHLVDAFREDLMRSDEARVKHEFKVEAQLEQVLHFR